MATKALRAAKEAGQGEYVLPEDGGSGQEWILGAYRALEPGVSNSAHDVDMSSPLLLSPAPLKLID